MPFIVRMGKSLISDTFLVITLSFIIGLVVSWLLVYLLSKWKVTSRLLLGKIQ